MNREQADGHLGLQLNEVFRPFLKYGHDAFVPNAKKQILELAWKYHLALNGEKIPISLSERGWPDD